MSDLISRQAAIDAAKILLDYYGTNDITKEFADNVAENFMNKLPSADRPQGWIPCSERLPEEEGWYLVTIQNDKTEKRRTENDLFAIGIAEAHKLTPYKFCKDGHRQTVIAWMPLPEPWKGADDE